MSFLDRLRELFTKTQAPVRAPTEELSTEQKTILKDWLEKNALPCTDIKFQRAEPDPAQDPFQSQCGGTPYFEANESWPETAAGEPLDLIAQIWNKEYTSFPAEYQLLQFYYHFESNAWSTKDNGWLIKMYKEPSRQKYISVERPPTTEYSPDFCHLILTPGISYPGVASLDDEPRADPSDILEFFDSYSDDHYEYYEALIDKKRTGLSTNSRLGGYPTEIQRYPGWRKNDGSTINVFLQLDSQDKAGFMWGDSGLVHFGFDPENQKIEFALQCA